MVGGGAARARRSAGSARRGARRAARGEGRVVFVSGEPGIGKTSLVTRFLADLDDGARVLFGTCDDLSIPRPLGPIRDLAGSVSPALEQALAGGAAPHEIQTLLVAELELQPRPTVLVLEDVHWADDATLDVDHGARPPDRLAARAARAHLPRRRGAARHRCTRRSARSAPTDSSILELAPLSQGAVASLAGDRAGEVYAATGGNPFYVTELLGSRAVDRPAAVGRERRARARVAARRRRRAGWSSSSRSCRAARARRCSTPSCRDWPDAAEEPERRQLLEVEPTSVRFRHELARHAIRSSVPAAARRRLHAEILDALLAARRRPGRDRPPRRGRGRRRRRRRVRARRRAPGGRAESNREAYSHYRRAADFVDRLDRGRAGGRARGAGRRRLRRRPARRRLRGDRARDRDLRARSATTTAVGRCTRMLSRYHWFKGDGEAARRKALEAIAILEPLGESAELARAYSGVSQLAMLAERHRRRRSSGASGRSRSRRGSATRGTRAHALVNIGSARLNRDGETGDAARGARGRRRRRRPARGGARARQPRPRAHVLGAARTRRCATRSRRLAYAAASTRCTRSRRTSRTIVAWLRLRAGEWDEAERICAARDRERITVVRSCSRRRCWPSWPSAAATPTPRERLADLVGAGRSHAASRSGSCRCSSWRSSGR